MTKTEKDRIQVAAFRCAYKLGCDLSLEERLLRAICQTSDEAFDRKTHEDKQKMREYLDVASKGARL